MSSVPSFSNLPLPTPLPAPIKHCAESLIYLLPLSSLFPTPPSKSSDLAILKHRPSKAYRHPDLDARLTKQRTRAEIRALVKARRGGVICPTVLSAGKDYIAMTYEAEGRTVRDYLNGLAAEKGNTSSAADKTESPTSSLTKEEKEALTSMTRSVIKLHATSVIHGDLTTSNFLLRPDGTAVAIDFGLAQVVSGNQQSKKRKTPASDGGGSTNKVEMYAVDLYVLLRALETSHRKGVEMAR